jgi:DNA repair exonuclease SbcCD ATPase subunit
VEGAERQVGEIGQRRSEQEAELAENQQAQARLQSELEDSLKQLDVQRENYLAERSNLEARNKQLGVLAAELAAVRTGIEEESRQRRTLTDKVAEMERAKHRTHRPESTPLATWSRRESFPSGHWNQKLSCARQSWRSWDTRFSQRLLNASWRSREPKCWRDKPLN